jgi:riboflavin kinase/FMN adenylyltransferase
MQQTTSLHTSEAAGAWVTIGVFDGVHLGHQQILKNLAAGAHAQGAPAVVLTFDPHPQEVLRGPVKSFYLNSPEEKAAHIAELGIDLLITHPFDKATAQMSAREFVTELKQRLGMTQLWVGHDFALGRNREGDFPALLALGKELGFSVHPVEAVMLDGEIVSSSRIRMLLSEAKVEAAARLLGRPYSLSGEVVDGAKRGRSIGIPTANTAINEKRLVPPTGVYVTWAHIGQSRWGAVTNIGLRPTFDDQLPAPVVETYMLDYERGEFYGQTLRLDFASRLRAEQRFNGVEELLAQIHIDIETARTVLRQPTD